MRRNVKKPAKMSVVAANTMRFGVIIVFLFIMVILNLLASSACTHLLKEKGEMEREINKLNEARMREATRWEAMKTPENVETALLKHGLSMRLPRPDQNVRMRSNGTPYPGQLSIARARQRAGLPVAVNKPAAKPKATTIAPPVRRNRSRR